MLRTGTLDRLWSEAGGGADSLPRDRLVRFARLIELDTAENLRNWIHGKLGLGERTEVSERVAREIADIKHGLSVERGEEKAKCEEVGFRRLFKYKGKPNGT